MKTLALALLLVAPAAAAQDHWQALMRGNARYVAGRLVYNRLRAQRDATRSAQHPPVTVISCADSRVPPELMFDRSVGDLFVIRVAGNVADPFNLASVEYAVLNKWTRLIVVMGHESCGAVKAALDGHGGTPALDALVAKIDRNLDGKKPPVKEAVELNAKATARQLVDESDVIRRAVEAREVKIVAAYYSFDGRVRLVP